MSARASLVAAERAPARTAAARIQATVSRPPRENLLASDGERIALPHRELLEERFGRPLDTIEVYASPRIAVTLRGMHAVSAARGEQIFLSSPSAPLTVVAHEVAHALQPVTAAQESRPDGSYDVEPAGSAAEREAADVAAEVSRPRVPAAPVSVSEGIGPDTLALLRVPSHRNGEDITLGTPSALPAAAVPTAPVPATAAPAAVDAEPALAPAQLSPAPAAATPNDAATEDGASGGLQLPPAGQLTVGTEQLAARETAIAEAQAALAGATTPTALLQAYAAAPPTVKARQAASLETDVAAVATTEAEQWQQDVPELHASLDGAEPPSNQVPVLAPPARLIELVDTAVAPAPEPQLPDVEVAGPFEIQNDAANAFSRFTEPDPAVLATQIGASLDSVQTVDPAVPRSPGPPPAIPLGGESDPARVAEVESAGRAQAAGLQEEATLAVVEGPGPERVQPSALDEAYPVGELPAPVVGTGTVPEGPDAYVAMGLPPEVQATFDEQQHAAMEQSMAETLTQSEQASTDRDSAKETTVTEAEAGVARLNEEADGHQTAAVLEARTDIQTSRQDTVDAQQAQVQRVEGEASEQRTTDETAIQTRVSEDQATIDASYASAESDIGAKITEGEHQASAKKEEAERKAENESWWDQAVNFVKEAFNSLIEAIGAVFDAVRDAVNGILDAVKAAVLAAIDAVAGFIKDAIAAYGALLQAAITGLIGEIFPELAAALTAAIDTAVTAAQNAVDVVANGLKAGVSALVEGLRAGLMAIIDAYQAAVTLALSFAAAAITGDWGALAIRVLEAVLRLIGVDPEQFYAFVGRAQETFQIIIDNPAGFLGNVLAAVGGGIQSFADNIVTHLQTGVIGWLTGALGGAGIVLPQTFDLYGVLDLARQILGLTWDMLKAKARTLIGEQNVERLELLFGFIETLVTEGWGALWNQIMDSVSTVFDEVFEGIKTFVRDRIIVSAITKLASLFSPVGAIVQLVLTAWNVYTFLRDQLARIAEVVQTVTTAIGDIARGILDNAMAAVEGVLARLLPLAIDFLARLIGLGNVGAKVREIIEKVQAMVDRGIDTMLQRIAAAFRGGGTAAGGADSGGVADDVISASGHGAFAAAAAVHLEEAAVDAPDLAALRTLAATLEPTLSQQLEPGIGLRFTFTGGASDVDDGIVDVDVVIAPNTTTTHQKVSIRGKSAPGIGTYQPHAGKPSSNRAGPELHHTESEHIIPYAIGDAVLTVIGISRGSRSESGKFDGALTTVMIYAGAADLKTNGQGADQALIRKFRQDAEAAGLRQTVATGSVAAIGMASGGSDESVDALAIILSQVERFRVDAVTRTNKAIVDEHATIAGGFKTTNGKRRGEASGIPDSTIIGHVSDIQSDEISLFAAHLFTASGGPSALPREPTENPKAVQTVTLAQLNGMNSVGEFAIIGSIGPVLGARLLAAKPFATRDDLARVTGIGDVFMTRVVG